MKKWLLVLCLGISCYAHAEKRQQQITNFSGGLNSYSSSLTIGDNEVKDALNVLFDEDNAVTKRKGFTSCGSSKTYSYDSGWTYTDSTSTSWLIVRSSDTIMAGSVPCAFTVKIATISANDQVNAVTAFGNIYFVDQTRGIFSWDGSNTAFLTGSPHGSLIAEFRNRLWVAGLAIPNGNLLYASGYLNPTNWSLGSLITDPLILTVGLQDNYDNISGLFSGYNDMLTAAKTRSIYGVFGFDQSDFSIRVLNREVGVIDQRSIQPYMGGLVFMSQRGVEFFDGLNATLTSRSIKNYLDSIALNTSYSRAAWLQSVNTDFGQWTTINLDTFTLTNQVRINGFKNQFATLSGWTTESGAWSTDGSSATPSTTGSDTISAAAIGGTFPGTVSGTSQYNNWKISAIASVDRNAGLHAVNTICAGLVNSSSRGYLACLSSLNSNQWQMSIENPGTGGVFCFSSAFGTSDTLQHTISLDRNVDSGLMTAYLDGVSATSCTSGSVSTPVNKPYIWAKPVIPDGTSGNNYTSHISQVNVIGFSNTTLFSNKYASIGTFETPAHALTGISSFGNFAASQDLSTGGTIDYAVCTAATAAMTGKVCTAVTNNTTIAMSTNAYVTVIGTFTVAVASNTPTLNAVTVNWFIGSRKSPMSSVVYDNRYWLSVTTNTSGTQNDAVFVMTKGPVWTRFNMNVGAFILSQGSLYHTGNTANGKVYLDWQGYNDDGAAINAYIRSKDFMPEGFMVDKLVRGLHVLAEPLGLYTLNSAYEVDRSGTLYSFDDITVDELSGKTSMILYTPKSAGYAPYGRSLSLRFGNNVADQPMKIYGGNLVYEARPMIQ